METSELISHALFVGGGLLAEHVAQVLPKLPDGFNTRVPRFPGSHLPQGGEGDTGPVCKSTNLSSFKSPKFFLKLCGTRD